MKRLIPVICLVLFIGSVVSCGRRKPIVKGNGDIIVEHIEMEEYEELEIAGNRILINYEVNEIETGLSITTDRNIYEKYTIEVVGKRLRILPKEEYKDYRFAPGRFAIKIKSPALRSIHVAGDVKLDVNSPFENNDLSLSMAGSSFIRFKEPLQTGNFRLDMAGRSRLEIPYLDADNFRVSVAGSANMELAGTCENMTIESAGRIKVSAFDLEAGTVTCSVAGSSNMQLRIKNKLNTSVAGWYKIRYKGNPSIDKANAGIGSFRRQD